MRIITGYLKGRIFKSPKVSRTHPMSDKIRGALFNMLGDLEGLKVLDAFAGSGAVAIEAISRQAAFAVAIESDRSAQHAIADNTRDLGITDKIKLVQTSAAAWLSISNESFDIIFLDPPYDNLQEATLYQLAGKAKPGGLVVISLPAQASFKLTNDYELLREKLYGNAQLLVYRKNA